MVRAARSPAISAALAAALLFGAGTPLAKQLLRDTSPVLLAGLLYLGSGIGLSAGRPLHDRGWRAPGLGPAEWRWLALAVGFGGVLAPLLLMLGLARTPAASASLLLNLEAVLTALLAWVVFRENTDRRVVLGLTAGAVNNGLAVLLRDRLPPLAGIAEAMTNTHMIPTGTAVSRTLTRIGTRR